jgi:hypothetical protein
MQHLAPYRVVIALSSLILPAACKSKDQASSGAASASSTASASVPAPAASLPPWVPPIRSSWPVPIGPRLAVLAGQGLGPIRFGATVKTIERLMEAPCDFQTADLCRYYKQAIDFELKDGVLARIHVHRFDRPAGNDATGKSRVYGAFNGGIPPDLRFGMLPWAIQEHLGKPLRVAPAPGERAYNVNSTAELHYYDGLILEYDRLPSGNLILGGIVIEKSSGQPKPDHS